MSIRRRAAMTRGIRGGRVPDAVLREAGNAMQQGRQMVTGVLSQASQSVRQEIQRARTIFEQAGQTLASDQKGARDAMAGCRAASMSAASRTAAAAEHGQAAARTAVNAMLERLNQITASFAPPPSPGPAAGAQGKGPAK